MGPPVAAGMKIISWNVNSIRVRMDRLKALLERHQPDLLCIQETKVQDEHFPHEDLVGTGYQATVFGQKSYNGVCFIHREPITDVRMGFDGNPAPEQARVISCLLGGVRVINCYVVNGESPDSPKFSLKMAWMDALRTWIAAQFDPTDQVLVLGDFNVCPDDRDVYDPVKWQGKIHCTPEERAQVQAFKDWGLVDLQRELSPDEGPFTWWGYRFGAFSRGWGLRIDLLLATPALRDRLVDVVVDRDERKETTGEGKPSDHAPVIGVFAREAPAVV